MNYLTNSQIKFIEWVIDYFESHGHRKSFNTVWFEDQQICLDNLFMRLQGATISTAPMLAFYDKRFLNMILNDEILRFGYRDSQFEISMRVNMDGKFKVEKK